MSCVRGTRQATVVFGLALAWAPALRAQTTYVCPPAPTGVPGLTGGPQFAATSPPDAFASQLADPRWTGAWREDFSATSTSQVAARILNDGGNIFLSLQAIVDPDGAQVGADGIYLGFSQDGTTAVFVKVVMDAAPPTGGFVNDATSISTASSWKTTDGGNSVWKKQGPQSWALPTGIHLWTGAGTGNGASWGFNVELSLDDLGTALGLAGPLTTPFHMWYEIVVETPSSSDEYAWPAGSAVAFDSTDSGCTPASPCAALFVSEWGIVESPTSSNCPAGISIGATSIGTTPLAAGVPGTTVFFGSGQPANDFVAELTNTDALNPLTRNAIQARFRIADWASTIGVGGSWTDLATTGTPAGPVHGANGATAGEISLPCVNPPSSSANVNCYQPPVGAPSTQGMLVELSQNNGSGYRFVHDSAWVDMSFVNPSTATGGAGGGAGSGGAGGGAVAGASGGAGTGGAAGAGGGSAGNNGSAGAAGSSAGNNGSAGAAGSSAGNNGSAGAAGSSAGNNGSAGAAGSSAGNNGSAGGGAGGRAGQSGTGGGAAGQGGESGAGGGSAGGKAGQGGVAGGAAGAGVAGHAGSGGAAGASGGQSGATGGGGGCSCGVGGSTPAGSLLFAAAGLLMLLRRGRVPHRRRARR